MRALMRRVDFYIMRQTWILKDVQEWAEVTATMVSVALSVAASTAISATGKALLGRGEGAMAFLKDLAKELVGEIAEELVLEPIFGEWLFTLFSVTRSGLGQKLEPKLEYEKAAARAAYFAKQDIEGLEAMSDAQQLSTWAMLKCIQKAAQNKQARKLMREFRSEFFAAQKEMSQAARAKNQERSWDEQRQAVPEALALGLFLELEDTLFSDVIQGHRPHWFLMNPGNSPLQCI